MIDSSQPEQSIQFLTTSGKNIAAALQTPVLRVRVAAMGCVAGRVGHQQSTLRAAKSALRRKKTTVRANKSALLQDKTTLRENKSALLRKQTIVFGDKSALLKISNDTFSRSNGRSLEGKRAFGGPNDRSTDCHRPSFERAATFGSRHETRTTHAAPETRCHTDRGSP